MLSEPAPDSDHVIDAQPLRVLKIDGIEGFAAIEAASDQDIAVFENCDGVATPRGEEDRRGYFEYPAAQDIELVGGPATTLRER
jgi:hypothetical protein